MWWTSSSIADCKAGASIDISTTVGVFDGKRKLKYLPHITARNLTGQKRGCLRSQARRGGDTKAALQERLRCRILRSQAIRTHVLLDRRCSALDHLRDFLDMSPPMPSRLRFHRDERSQNTLKVLFTLLTWSAHYPYPPTRPLSLLASPAEPLNRLFLLSLRSLEVEWHR